MPGLFQGLEIGRRALMTHQLSLTTTGHNIANVNTPGYSRQRVNVTATLPENSTFGILGTGVKVADIRNIRDLFLGKQFREENKSMGQWSYKEKILSEVETMFNEPNDNTLSGMMNEVWGSWSALSTYDGTRSNVLAVAENLTAGFHELSNQLNRLRESIDLDINNVTKEINRMTSELGRLNNQITSLEMGNTRANDLRDRRDLLLDQLSTLIDVNSIENKAGDVTVYIGAMSIVNGPDTMRIDTKVANINGQPVHQLVWEGTSITITNLNGQLKGLVDSRDELIPRYMEQLDTIAAAVVEQVNSLHITGYGLDGSTGVAFFDPSCVKASNIKINMDILNNPSSIAASASGEEGDQEIALAISKLRDAAVMEDDTLSIDDFYNSLVGTLGVESKQAQSFTSNFELLLEQIEFSRQSVQGVSLDEEMTNMIKYQQSYDAAARFITAMDQALDTVIATMGIVGR